MKKNVYSSVIKFILCTACILTVASGCSGKKKTDEQAVGTESADGVTDPVAAAGTDPVPPESAEGNVAPATEEAGLPPVPTEESTVQAAVPSPESSTAPESVEASVAQETPQPSAPPVSEAVAEFQTTYTFQSGDTLMKIAFDNYGDLYRWKKIYEDNRDKIQNPNAVPVGTVLNLEKPSSPVTVDRNGEKYVIRSGDTLGKISNHVYGTMKKWKRLWENNKQMIRDPNRIFAGFSLYYTFTEEDRQDLEKNRLKTRVPASGP